MNNSNFKQTEIGQIPEDWEVVRLGDPKVAEAIFYGITAKASNKCSDFKMLRTTDIKDYNFVYDDLPFCEITDSRNKLSQYKLFRGDIIIARAGTVGVSILVGKNYDDAIFGSYLIKIRIKDGVYPRFVHYFFQSNLYWKHIRKAQGSTLKNINLPLLKSLILPLPPLPEQKKIAEVLLTVDQAIEKVDEAIAKTERLKKGLMQELLTKGIGHKEFKETEIGRIPQKWRVIKFENVLKLEYGKGLTEMERKGSKYPVYGSNGIVGYNSKYLVKGPGIIVGRKGTIGAIKWSEDNFWPIDTTYYVKLKEFNIDLKWLYYKLSILGLSKLNMATGTPGLNRELVHKIKISLPSLPEQKKIAEILLTVDKRMELLKEKKEKLERVKKGLMNELLTGKRRVKINFKQGE